MRTINREGLINPGTKGILLKLVHISCHSGGTAQGKVVEVSRGKAHWFGASREQVKKIDAAMRCVARVGGEQIWHKLQVDG